MLFICRQKAAVESRISDWSSVVGSSDLAQKARRVTVFFFEQKTAYELRISDWSSDVCSSDLVRSYDKWGAHLRQMGCPDTTDRVLHKEWGFYAIYDTGVDLIS